MLYQQLFGPLVAIDMSDNGAIIEGSSGIPYEVYTISESMI